MQPDFIYSLKEHYFITEFIFHAIEKVGNKATIICKLIRGGILYIWQSIENMPNFLLCSNKYTKELRTIIDNYHH